jgi:hypothetical protein
MSWAVLDELDFDAIRSDESVAAGVFEQVGRVVARGDVPGMSDDDLLGAVGALQRTRRQLDAGEAHVLAELDARGITDERRGLRTGGWVAFEAHTSIPVAQRRVGLSTRLRDDLPLVDQALTAGLLDWSHVEVLSRAANPRIIANFTLKLPALIGLAQELAFDPWRRHVTLVAARLDFDGGYRPELDPEASKLFIDRLSGDDLTLLRGMFTGATGSMIAQIIEERADQLWHRYRNDHDTTNGEINIPSRPSLRAIALEELLLEARAADPTKSKPPVTDLTVVLRWNVSDLFPDGIIPDDVFGGGLIPDGAFSNGATLESLFAQGRYENRRIPDGYETFDGCTHCETTMQDRLCDPAIRFLITDEAGCPLNLGRTQRFANDDQRRAAKIRDGGCTFPGCDCMVSRCDLHHVNPYGDPNSDGGPTDITNLACLCRFHHGITHRKGWRMVATGDGWFEWHTPNGTTLLSQRGQKQRAGPAPNTL